MHMINGKKSQISAMSGGLLSEVLSMFLSEKNWGWKGSVGDSLIHEDC
jgi:hypothetical protein